MSHHTALVSQHPRRLDVQALILVAAGLLLAAYFLPTLKLTKIIFFTDTYSIWAGIAELWKSQHYLLAALVFAFSMLFPVAKLVGLAWVWYVPMTPVRREHAADWIGQLGKWSMVDVFVVAILIVLIKAQDLADAEAGIGIYLFAAAVILSMIASVSVERLARRPEPA